MRVIFADDEEMARRRMRRLLEELGGVEIVGEATSGEEALALLDRLDVDLALLDVHMGLVSGLDVSTAAAELGVEVVLTTAHAEHAVRAFDAGALDYLLKPIELERLGQAIERAKSRIAPAPPVGGRPTERLAIDVKGEVRFVRAESISHALLDGSLVTLFSEVSGGAEALLTELSLTELSRKLPHLMRVHRRALLSLDHVERLRPLPTGGYVAFTRAGHEVPVSRQSARELRRRLGLA